MCSGGPATHSDQVFGIGKGRAAASRTLRLQPYCGIEDPIPTPKRGRGSDRNYSNPFTVLPLLPGVARLATSSTTAHQAGFRPRLPRLTTGGCAEQAEGVFRHAPERQRGVLRCAPVQPTRSGSANLDSSGTQVQEPQRSADVVVFMPHGVPSPYLLDERNLSATTSRLRSKLFCPAHASMSVPSTVRACSTTSVKNSSDTAPYMATVFMLA